MVLKKSLSNEEQINILEKLRIEYRDNAKKYGKKVFDLSAFEDRLQFTLDNRINMSGFLLAEVSVIEKIKDKINKKIKERENSFSVQIDKMIEENLKKIAHYPEYNIHPKANSELKKLLGTLSSFSKSEFHWIELVIRTEKNVSFLNTLNSLREKMNYLVGNQGVRNAPRIEDHLLILNRKLPDYAKIELDWKRFVRDIALFLNELKDFLINLLYENKLKSPKSLIQIKKLASQSLNDTSGLNDDEILKKVIKKIDTILSDFRIAEFKYSVK